MKIIFGRFAACSIEANSSETKITGFMVGCINKGVAQIMELNEKPEKSNFHNSFHPDQITPFPGIILLHWARRTATVKDKVCQFHLQALGYIGMFPDKVSLFPGVRGKVVKLSLGATTILHNKFPFALTDGVTAIGTMVDHPDTLSQFGCIPTAQCGIKTYAILPCVRG
jgi:hypothetical protein